MSAEGQCLLESRLSSKSVDIINSAMGMEIFRNVSPIRLEADIFYKSGEIPYLWSITADISANIYRLSGTPPGKLATEIEKNLFREVIKLFN